MTVPGGSLEAVVIPLTAVVGLFVGSFLNVVVYRAPLGLSVSRPRSFCPTCDRQLAWWENVPLLSWLLLRGRCHSCHQRISVRYPLVEAGTAVVFAFVAWAWHGTLPTAGYCVLAATATAVALVEYGGQRSPLAVGAIGTLLGALLLIPGLLVAHRPGALAWMLVGLALGSAIVLTLRTFDPDCLDVRAHGRTALALAGAWLGGLAGRPTVAGLTAWVMASSGCLLVVWAVRQGHGHAGEGRPAPRIPTVVAAPLVTGIAVALAVSLGVAA
jgi:leader peptidase (prepilin peptidase)/N-methyltransferase